MKAKSEIENIKKIKDIGKEIYLDIISNKQPKISIPLRSLQNVAYNKEKGYFEIRGIKKNRTLTASTSKTFAQTLKMMGLSKMLIETNDIATKRDVYYQSKNWSEARFEEQPESDTIMDDIEAMIGVNREQLGFIPDERGGAIAGELKIIDKDIATSEEIVINCAKMGSGGYSIPSSVEHLKFETKADFILAIETDGMYERLVRHAFWKKFNCILISLGGVPTRACRRFIRKLSDEFNLPVYVFCDCDCYAFLNIYRTLKVGSGNAAHINKFFCVPQAKFIGITPKDIIDYKLPTHPLKEVDIKRIQDGLKNDPFVKAYPEWQQALKLQLEMRKRAEQQALARWGLNYVISDYLPEKLANPKSWLP